MRTNKALEALYSKYSEPDTLHGRYTPPPYTPKRAKGSLNDLYREVQSVINRNEQSLYQNKNAREIEISMMRNRKLIETARYTHR